MQRCIYIKLVLWYHLQSCSILTFHSTIIAYRFSDGGRYEGEWINGRYEGRGRCEWHDGRIYEGEWKAGMAHGVGVETYPDGRIRHSGKWIKDEPIREQRMLEYMVIYSWELFNFTTS